MWELPPENFFHDGKKVNENEIKNYLEKGLSGERS